MKPLAAFFVWSLLASYLSGQGFSIKEIPYPAGVTYCGVFATAPDGRLWAACLGGTVIGQRVLGDNVDVAIVGSVPTNVFFESISKSIAGSTAVMGGFSPQNGEVVSIAPSATVSKFIPSPGQGILTTYRNFEYQASLNPPALKQVCLDYTVNGNPAPTTISGPSYFGSDMYYLATDNAGTKDAKSTVYLKGTTSPTGICDLLNGTSLGSETLQAWKQADGSFVKETVISVDPINGASTEIGTQLPNGSTKVLVSPNKSSNPQIPATLCCDMVTDTSNGSFLITYRVPSGRAIVRFKDGSTKEIYANEDGLANTNIRAISLRGDWALMWVGSNNPFALDTPILVNVLTKKVYPIMKDLFSGRSIWAVALTPQGKVFVDFAIGSTFAQLTIPGVTGILPAPTITNFIADPSAVIEGDPVTLSWVTDATSVAINQGVGTVPAAGSVTVTPTVSVPSYTLTATGPGGNTSSTVTVTVTPRALVPMIADGGVVNAASFTPLLSPGTYVSIFGSNLSDSTATAVAPYPNSLSGVMALVNRAFVPVQYVSPGKSISSFRTV